MDPHPAPRRRVEWTAVTHGALVDLAVFLPFVITVAILKHNDLATEDSYLWVASALAVFIAPVVGGVAAARRQPRAPLLHGAAAAFTAALVYVAFRLIDGAIGGRAPHAGELILFVQLSVAMGIVGGYGGFRGYTTSPSSGHGPTIYPPGGNDL